MRLKLIAIGMGIGCLVDIAIAQAPKPSPELEAMGGKLMQEINANIQCNANAIAGRGELEKLQKELEGLKKELADAILNTKTGSNNGRGKSQP